MILKDIKKGRVYVALLIVAIINILERLAAGAFVQFALEPNVPDDFILIGLIYGAVVTIFHILALVGLAYAVVTDGQ